MKDKVDVMLVEKLTNFEEGRGAGTAPTDEETMSAREKDECSLVQGQPEAVRSCWGPTGSCGGEQAGCCLSSRLINDLVSGPLFSVMMCCCLFRGISPPDRGILG